MNSIWWPIMFKALTNFWSQSKGLEWGFVLSRCIVYFDIISTCFIKFNSQVLTDKENSQ